MKRPIAMNQLFALTVILLVSWALVSPMSGFSQALNDVDEEEEAIDLDSLEEEEKGDKNNGFDTQELLLPDINDQMVERQPHTGFMLVAIILLMPLVSMTVPVQKGQRGK